MQKLILSLAIYLFSYASLAATNPLLLAIYGVNESTQSFRITQSIVSEIALRCETDIKLVAIPSHRIIGLLRSEEIDGGLSVLNRFDEEIPELITVPTPLATLPLQAYAKKKDLNINGWDSLQPYTVTYNSSLVVVESQLQSINANTVSFSNDEAALKFISSDRADLFIGLPFLVEPLLKTKELKTSGIEALLPPFEVYKVYMHILPKHAKRGECFSKALKNMNDDKTYEKILSGESLD